MKQMSEHALRRIQQRSIPHDAIDLLNCYGSKQYDGHGAVVRYFDHSAKARLRRTFGDQFLQLNTRLLSTYFVEDSAQRTIITAGYRNRRIRRR